LHSLQVPRAFFESELESPEPGEVPLSWIMVLLLKQVHLQKEVEATNELASWNECMEMSFIQAARLRVTELRRRTRRRSNRGGRAMILSDGRERTAERGESSRKLRG